MNQEPGCLLIVSSKNCKLHCWMPEAHARIAHRDIKSSNIMITPGGQIKVLDFGLAKISKPKIEVADSAISTLMKTKPGVAIGTVHYMSPEQALGKNVDHRTDI